MDGSWELSTVMKTTSWATLCGSRVYPGEADPTARDPDYDVQVEGPE
jgi:hypothetical protein